MGETQIQRITRMEDIYDRSSAAVEKLLQHAEAYLNLQNELKELEYYYESRQWMVDLNDDKAGLIPKDLKRGILTEDAIYDLLTDNDRLIRLLKKIISR